jgi:hypothetical protein
MSIVKSDLENSPKENQSGIQLFGRSLSTDETKIVNVNLKILLIVLSNLTQSLECNCEER